MELITETTLFHRSNVVPLQTLLDIFNGNITERMKLLWEDRKQHKEEHSNGYIFVLHRSQFLFDKLP